MTYDVFVDMDGVLTDFIGAVEDFYGLQQTNEERAAWDGVINAYKRKSGRTTMDFWNDLPVTFWSDMPETRECRMILAMVEQYSPMILTAPPISQHGVGHCVTGKLLWLKKNLPDYFWDARFMVGSRKEVCAKKNAVLIDDNTANCFAWSDKGGKAILVPRPWNRFAGDNTMLSVQVQFRNIFEEED
jgi:hypothetical protein